MCNFSPNYLRNNPYKGVIFSLYAFFLIPAMRPLVSVSILLSAPSAFRFPPDSGTPWWLSSPLSSLNSRMASSRRWGRRMFGRGDLWCVFLIIFFTDYTFPIRRRVRMSFSQSLALLFLSPLAWDAFWRRRILLYIDVFGETLANGLRLFFAW